MLNITRNPLNAKVDLSTFKAGQRVFPRRHYQYFNRLLFAFFVLVLLMMFLPWTQNIQGEGFLTTLTPDQRPQTIQSPIPGRIEKWYVREGDRVSKGDTILFISEIKNEYFDPNLVERTDMQVEAKSLSVRSYKEKVKALEAQIEALTQERILKLEMAENKLLQAKYKVQADSIDLVAARTNLRIAERQFERSQTLNSEGLLPVTHFEAKSLKLQETQAKLISQENKLLGSRNEVINAQVEIGRIKAEYVDKISKARSEKFTAESSRFDSEAMVTKLENERTNYEMRRNLYYITAPQDGFINRALQTGIGETFKEGDKLVGIMPTNYQMAVETFVDPIDLPLINLGEKVRIQFDGWPAIVFSGWPNVSYGTYGGEVVAIETFISENGKYRILLSPDPDDHEWPVDLRIGSGARTIALLSDVPIWYELWRQLNGFPPDYYQPKGKQEKLPKIKIKV